MFSKLFQKPKPAPVTFAFVEPTVVSGDSAATMRNKVAASAAHINHLLTLLPTVTGDSFDEMLNNANASSPESARLIKVLRAMHIEAYGKGFVGQPKEFIAAFKAQLEAMKEACAAAVTSKDLNDLVAKEQAVVDAADAHNITIEAVVGYEDATVSARPSHIPALTIEQRQALKASYRTGLSVYLNQLNEVIAQDAVHTTPADAANKFNADLREIWNDHFEFTAEGYTDQLTAERLRTALRNLDDGLYDVAAGINKPSDTEEDIGKLNNILIKLAEREAVRVIAANNLAATAGGNEACKGLIAMRTPAVSAGAPVAIADYQDRLNVLHLIEEHAHLHQTAIEAREAAKAVLEQAQAQRDAAVAAMEAARKPIIALVAPLVRFNRFINDVDQTGSITHPKEAHGAIATLYNAAAMQSSFDAYQSKIQAACPDAAKRAEVSIIPEVKVAPSPEAAKPTATSSTASVLSPVAAADTPGTRINFVTQSLVDAFKTQYTVITQQVTASQVVFNLASKTDKSVSQRLSYNAETQTFSVNPIDTDAVRFAVERAGAINGAVKVSGVMDRAEMEAIAKACKDKNIQLRFGDKQSEAVFDTLVKDEGKGGLKEVLKAPKRTLVGPDKPGVDSAAGTVAPGGAPII